MDKVSVLECMPSSYVYLPEFTCVSSGFVVKMEFIR
jgi:hypothetical protein